MDIFSNLLDSLGDILSNPDYQGILIGAVVIVVVFRIAMAIRWVRYVAIVAFGLYLLMLYQNGNLGEILDIQRPFFNL